MIGLKNIHNLGIKAKFSLCTYIYTNSTWCLVGLFGIQVGKCRIHQLFQSCKQLKQIRKTKQLCFTSSKCPEKYSLNFSLFGFYEVLVNVSIFFSIVIRFFLMGNRRWLYQYLNVNIITSITPIKQLFISLQLIYLFYQKFFQFSYILLNIGSSIS